ncbi:MAG: DNA ligase D [Rhizobiaceae bacterium]|nr:MAG: DNA ligase D [Rhizobiaceae bacterium]CAG1014740.1 Multifunctional non-homologous end joining protein LigD [Rhizobiaceae bacterium]
MALDAYRRRRDFTRTAEPKGMTDARGEGWSFVVQKHDARRLHYDFRLEMDGVLKSWAVTRGPSLVPGEKRLAVHVEDHPLDYGSFEGTIPKGEYGGGTVIVWDRGVWAPIGDVRRGYRKGHLEFELDGEKLRGRWHLVKMAGRGGEKRENWLLIKGDDEYARDEKAPDILEERPESVLSGRVIADVENEAPGWSSKRGRLDPAAAEDPPVAVAEVRGARRADDPGFVSPALATLRASAPTGSRWLHEIKFDGYRLQAHVAGGKARLFTRSGLDWTDRFGAAVPAALAALSVDTGIIDGELVVEAAGGASDFAALQADLSEGRSDRFRFYAFDLLYLDGYDLRGCALVDRKAALKALLDGANRVVAYSEHFDEEGEIILRHACRLSLEGVVSKVRTGKYPAGRSREWIKSKCSDRQEFVIAGYVPSTTSDRAVGSLVLGYHGKRGLVYAGRVGTGFSRKVAEDLYRRLEPLRREDSPFASRLAAEARRGVRFTEPRLVAEVEFRSWTADRLLRHAAFRGLREDKPAEEIVREETAKAMRQEPAPRVQVRLTHPDRLYWKDAGVTKEGLADYYSQVWPFMAPFVVSRALALLRCPSGAEGQCFFQKHAWKGHHKAILTLDDPNDSSDEPILAIDGIDGLIGLVQAAVLEIHPWQASLPELERPDQIVIDLDPGEGVEWQKVIDAAREVRDRLAGAALESFVKTTGGKGLHVVAPLKPAAGWEDVKAFTKGMAEDMAADAPDRFVATIAKSKRRGKILVDYLRNQRGATAVAPYSTRARAGAPVAMPLAWEELSPAIGSSYFTVNNAVARLANLPSDPWQDFRKAEAPLRERSGRRPAGKARSR